MHTIFPCVEGSMARGNNEMSTAVVSAAHSTGLLFRS